MTLNFEAPLQAGLGDVKPMAIRVPSHYPLPENGQLVRVVDMSEDGGYAKLQVLDTRKYDDGLFIFVQWDEEHVHRWD